MVGIGPTTTTSAARAACTPPETPPPRPPHLALLLIYPEPLHPARGVASCAHPWLPRQYEATESTRFWAELGLQPPRPQQ